MTPTTTTSRAIIFCISVLLLLTGSCRTARPLAASTAGQQAEDSLITLQVLGKQYPARVHALEFAQEEAAAVPPMSLLSARTTTSTSCAKWGSVCGGDIFSGCMMRDIKLSYVTGTYQRYKNPRTLLRSLTRNSNEALKQLPRDEHRTRVAEENRNVIIEEGYLYYVSREEDNDYHLILGDKKNYKTSSLFSAEISGLPEDENAPGYHHLADVREKFLNQIGAPPRCSNTKKYSIDLTANPIKLTIKGSLLFDVQHKEGGSGYGDVKTKTAWEIHPVKDFDLID
jgi:hypothetical protein